MAYERECAAIRTKVKGMIEAASEPGDLWRIHEYLTDQRDQTGEKYDYRYLVLPLVFARLLKEGWLTDADLQGLREDKMQVIKRLASLGI